MKTRLKTFVFTISLVILMIACLPVWAGGAKDTGEKEETLTVDFWTAPNQAQFDFWKDKVSAFNKSGVTVDGQVIEIALQMMPETPSSEAGIQNALATGTAPAASTNINMGFAATLEASDRVYPLQDEEFFKNISKNRSTENMLKGWEINGNQYVIPLYANAMGYHWNTIVLKELGFKDRVPETVDDIRKLVSKFYELKDTKMKEMGIHHLFLRPQLLKPDWWWDRWFDFQMQYEAFSGGGNWVTGNKLTLDKKITEEVFEFFGMFGSSVLTAEDWTAFEQDTVAVTFQVCAPWDLPKYEAAGKVYGLDGDYVFGPPIVKSKGDIPYTFADAKGIVFYKDDNITEAEHNGAVAFVNWCFTGEQGSQTDLDWVKTAGMLPFRGDLLQNAAFQKIIENNPAYQYLATAIPYSIPAMAHEKMVDIQLALGEKGLTPYIQTTENSLSLIPPSSKSYVEAAFEAMLKEGELD